MEGPNWQQPFIFIFEWGMFILGWGIVTILSILAILVVAAFIRAAYVTVTKKNKASAAKPSDEERIQKAAEQMFKQMKDSTSRSSGSLDDNPPKI